MIRSETNGNVWTVFGSWWAGIYLMQLDFATGMRKTGSPLTHLATNNNIEVEGMKSVSRIHQRSSTESPSLMMETGCLP